MTDRRDPRPARSRDATADPRSLPDASDDIPTVVFVCTGNICRSPMAEAIARTHALSEGVRARFTSAGVSDEEHGNPIDPRAVRQLRSAGYTTAPHVAHRITDAELAEAHLIIGLEEHHVRALRRPPTSGC